MNNDSIKYTDETDKSFGLAGMAISLMVWDAETLLDHIDIDSGPDSAMHRNSTCRPPCRPKPCGPTIYAGLK